MICSAHTIRLFICPFRFLEKHFHTNKFILNNVQQVCLQKMTHRSSSTRSVLQLFRQNFSRCKRPLEANCRLHHVHMECHSFNPVLILQQAARINREGVASIMSAGTFSLARPHCASLFDSFRDTFLYVLFTSRWLHGINYSAEQPYARICEQFSRPYQEPLQSSLYTPNILHVPCTHPLVVFTSCTRYLLALHLHMAGGTSCEPP